MKIKTLQFNGKVENYKDNCTEYETKGHIKSQFSFVMYIDLIRGFRDGREYIIVGVLRC